MHLPSRRGFLAESALVTAALTALRTPRLRAATDPDPAQTGGKRDKVRIAVIGVHGRGMAHLQAFAGRNNAEVVTICDVDEAVIAKGMKLVQDRQGQAPAYVKDLRKVLDDKNIDAVSIATPNHWHALAAIWAMQAGKDVYVEKPVSHNVSEGRRIVEVASKTKRICQAGMQNRSMKGIQDSIAYLHAGRLGKVSLARGICYKLRPSIGKVKQPTPVPKTMDYDLWCGPAFNKPVQRANLHYDWHWIWDYGNGELGNQGVHEMDKARWGLNKSGLPRSVVSLGGRFGYQDDGETANTQLTFLDYGDSQIIFEVRGLPSKNPYPANVLLQRIPLQFIGNIWYGTEGVLVCPNYTSGVVLNPDGEVVETFQGDGDHFGNFLDAVISRNAGDLQGKIEEGHVSSALCHLGNISYRLGTMAPFRKPFRALGNDREAVATFDRMQEHLKTNALMLNDLEYRVGRKLAIDVEKERILHDKEANTYLTRPYRRGFAVPAQA
jgi:predicted dehydrogenase